MTKLLIVCALLSACGAPPPDERGVGQTAEALVTDRAGQTIVPGTYVAYARGDTLMYARVVLTATDGTVLLRVTDSSGIVALNEPAETRADSVMVIGRRQVPPATLAVLQ